MGKWIEYLDRLKDPDFYRPLKYHKNKVMETIINLILMKIVGVEELKSDDFLLAFDPSLCKWFKCKVNEIKKYTVTLEYLDGDSKGFIFYETLENLKNPDYYKQAE